MHIGTPEVTCAAGLLTWTVPVHGLQGAPDRLWFSVPEEHGGLVTDLADPAVIGLLIPAMHAGEPLEVEGQVTDELAHSLNAYQHILQAVIPGVRRADWREINGGAQLHPVRRSAAAAR